MKNGPKILFLDIETTFLVGAIWGIWNVTLGIDQLLDNGKILCYTAKWEKDKNLIFKRHDDSDFLITIHALLDEADAVVTYNGRKFDIPFINREFLKAGLTPPSPYKEIDLLETVKKRFKFPSNKLAHISRELEIGNKVKHEGFELWIKCINNDEQAWNKMERYNIQDVRLLEKLYRKLLPWISSSVNYCLYSAVGDPICPRCGSDHLHSRGKYKSNTGIFQRFHCQVCGHWSRSRYTEVPKEQRSNILVTAT